MVHPECRREVVALANEVLSTSGMLKYVKSSKNKEFIIGTEIGLIHSLEKENSNKKFYYVEQAICPNMKKIRLEDLLFSLEELKYKISVPKDIEVKAKKAINEMLKYSA